MKTNFRKVWKVLKYFFPVAHSVKPLYFVVLIVQVLLRSSMPFISIIFPKMIIDELLGNQNLGLLIVYASLLIGLNFILKAFHEILKCTIEDYSDAIQRHFEIQIGLKAMKMDYQYTEDPEVLTQKSKARSGMYMNGGVEGLSNLLVQMISALIVMVGEISIILLYSPWIILFILISVAFSTFVHIKTIQISRKYYLEISPLNKVGEYVFYDLTTFRYGKDVRLYQAASMFEEKANWYQKALFNNQKAENISTNRWNITQILFSGVLDIFAYLYIGWLALTKSIGIGTFTMLIVAMTSLSQSMKSIIDSFVDLKRDADYLNEYILFIEYPDVIEKNKLDIPIDQAMTIELKDVSFQYPKTDRFILKNVNLLIPSGERLSIVGLNGEGKTTLVKLITRLYDVTSGAILVNGVNIKEYDYEAYHQLFSVVFQDFKLFAFTIKENIWGDQEVHDELTIGELSGIQSKVDRLPKGLDTHIYKIFDEFGFEPSGGEAQKIAIARAIAKDAPIMILDEPTSALDPIAEYEIYHHFNTMIQNKTAIYISHRLSSCRFADKIALFHEGNLVEYGDHPSLINARGKYAEMYQTQSTYYSLKQKE